MDRRFSKNIGFNYFILGGVKHSEKKVTVEEVRFSLMRVFIPIDRLYLTSSLSVLDTRVSDVSQFRRVQILSLVI